MESNGTKSENPSFITKLFVIAGFIVEILGKLLTDEQVDHWIGHKGDLKANLHKLFSHGTFVAARLDWQVFYQKAYGQEVDFTNVMIPDRPSGNRRLLFIAKGVRGSGGLSYQDNNLTVYQHFRTTEEHYAVWVQACDEADPDYRGMSAQEADVDMSLGITLIERMVLGAKYHDETGKHLDVAGMGGTFCSGSRTADGRVPYVRFYQGYTLIQAVGENQHISGSGVRKARA